MLVIPEVCQDGIRFTCQGTDEWAVFLTGRLIRSLPEPGARFRGERPCGSDHLFQMGFGPDGFRTCIGILLNQGRGSEEAAEV